VVYPITSAWDVELGIVRGYSSETFAEDIAATTKRTYVFQLGDHDPSGVDAWRSFEARVRGFAPDADAVFERLAVTPEQIIEFNLPTRPTKTTDTRARGFIGESVEVDARFLDGARSTDRYWAAYLLLATTGMRRGEALGLRWADLDLMASRAAIRQTVVTVNHDVRFGTPKTAKGRRTVTLDVVTLAALREHRKVQAAERLLVGAGWRDHDLVFAKVDGTPLHPERFSREFTRRSARLGLPPIRLHDLRHGWATMALAAGFHPKVVQERLGHASISITLDLYSHVSPALHGEAAETVAALVFGTVR